MSNAQKRKEKGLVGRNWAIENGFTHKGMCDAMTNGIEACLKNFKPVESYELIDMSKPKPNYPTGVLV